MSRRLSTILIPLLSVILGLVVGAIIMAITGYSPVKGYTALWNGIFGDMYTIGESVRQITPYLLGGLAVAFAFKVGLFNIGVEGQLIVGWFAAAYVGFSLEGLPAFIHLPLALLAAAIAGGIWAFIPGILKARLGVNEVVVTIMLNYTALHVTNALVRAIANSDTSPKVFESASLRNSFFEDITFYSRMHNGIFIALIAVIVVWFILDRTKLGFEMKAVGFNQHASQYAGINVKRNIVVSMTISGLLAGLAGAMEALGTFEYVSTKGATTGIGFDSIAVAILGANNPLGVIFGAVLFGSLKYGSLNMPNAAGIPAEMVSIIIAIIIFFVASGFIFRYFLDKLSKKKEVK